MIQLFSQTDIFSEISTYWLFIWQCYQYLEYIVSMADEYEFEYGTLGGMITDGDG